MLLFLVSCNCGLEGPKPPLFKFTKEKRLFCCNNAIERFVVLSLCSNLATTGMILLLGSRTITIDSSIYR